MADQKIDIDGHMVPSHLVDYFFHGDDGTRVTDREWDEQRERMRQFNAWPFDQKAV